MENDVIFDKLRSITPGQCYEKIYLHKKRVIFTKKHASFFH